MVQVLPRTASDAGYEHTHTLLVTHKIRVRGGKTVLTIQPVKEGVAAGARVCSIMEKLELALGTKRIRGNGRYAIPSFLGA